MVHLKCITCFRTLHRLWCHDVMCDITCSGHMTFFYKRLAGTSFWALFCSFCSYQLLVHTPGSPWSPAYGWCLTHVGHDVSSMSPGWSLLPSSVIIESLNSTFALVNSAVSHRGLRYLNETWECHPAPCQYHFHRTVMPFSWCPRASW